MERDIRTGRGGGVNEEETGKGERGGDGVMEKGGDGEGVIGAFHFKVTRKQCTTAKKMNSMLVKSESMSGFIMYGGRGGCVSRGGEGEEGDGDK